MKWIKCHKCNSSNAIEMETKLGNGIEVELKPCLECGKLFTFKEYNNAIRANNKK